MHCVKPRGLLNPAGTNLQDNVIIVPCGKCYACLANLRASWLFRLTSEYYDNSMINVFATLTYNDDYCDGLVHKDHLQKFFKRLRKRDIIFKYYAIGEYGTHTLRPHYHCFVSVKDMPLLHFVNHLDQIEYYINQCWDYGNTVVSRANVRRLNYVLHYHVRPKEPVKGLKTFCLISKGIGSNILYRDDFVSYILDGNYSVRTTEGKYCLIPRYYRRKITDMYNVSLPTNFDPVSEHLDYIKSFRTKYGCLPWQMSIERQQQLMDDLIRTDTNKLKKYNYQDKL